MKSWAYYNEHDAYAAHRLRQNIAQGLIAPGYVDERSIKEVLPDDLEGFTQCHFFAGLGLWSYAARLAGWPDDRDLWTGSCPCQPFSAAGKGRGTDDPRHLWPDFFRLIRARRPSVIMGEQVSGAPGYGWFDGVLSDLEGENYAGRAEDIPSCSVDAPHIRNRLYWIARREAMDDAAGTRRGERRSEAVAQARDETRIGKSERRNGDGCGASNLAHPDCGREAWRCLRGPKQGADKNSERPHGQSGGSDCGCDMAHADKPQLRQKPSAWQQPLVQHDARNHGEGGTRDMGHAARIGRREGSASPDLRRWWDAVASTNVRDRGVTLGDAFGSGLERQRGHGDAWTGWTEQDRPASPADGRNGSWWADADWLLCHDGKARRTQPGLRLLVDGYTNRISDWRCAGNAINPVLAAEVIRAYLETEMTA